MAVAEASYTVAEPDTNYHHYAPTEAAGEVEAEKKPSYQMHPETWVEVPRRQFERLHLYYYLMNAEATASSVEVAAAEAYASSGLDRMGLLYIRLLSLAATWFYLTMVVLRMYLS